jgi:FkbM family methyltransferase
MDRGLIYDVGVNNGSDTAFYLRCGYKVVGIEASPVMAALLERKFASEIETGRFVLLIVGVAASEGEMEFWISDKDEWSSFDRAIASRNGTPHRPVRVQTRRFDTIIAEHGIPYYCKIDIEENDRLCLLGLSATTAPPFISIEMAHKYGDEDIARLRDLGYTQFKIVSQMTRAQPNQLLTRLGYALPAARKIVRKALGVESVRGWRFPAGSSGPFGNETPGPWHSYEWALRTWRFLHDIDQRYAINGSGDEWFDVHATKPHDET